jgi:hypothetical protein
VNPAEEFRRHAGECRRMACDTPDLESKAAWDRLADRWVRCAELEEARRAPERRPPPDTDTPRGRFIGTLLERRRLRVPPI